MAEIGLIEARRPRPVFFWRPEQLGRMTSILQLQAPGIVQLQYLRNRPPMGTAAEGLGSGAPPAHTERLGDDLDVVEIDLAVPAAGKDSPAWIIAHEGVVPCVTHLMVPNCKLVYLRKAQGCPEFTNRPLECRRPAQRRRRRRRAPVPGRAVPQGRGLQVRQPGYQAPGVRVDLAGLFAAVKAAAYGFLRSWERTEVMTLGGARSSVDRLRSHLTVWSICST